MPASGYHLRPQVPTAQPRVTEPRHRHRGRHGWGQPAQPAAARGNPGPLCLGPHDAPGDRHCLWAVDHTDHQGHQVILWGGRIPGPQAAGQLRPLRGQPGADVLPCSSSTQGHTRVLECGYYDPQLTGRSGVRLPPHPASRITWCRVCAAPPQPIYEPACGWLFHGTVVRNTLVNITVSG